jgi:hypothetical protein
MHMPPPPPEFLKAQSEYRRERIRSGSTGDPFTAVFVLLLYLVRLVIFLVAFPVKLLLKLRPKAVKLDQEQGEDMLSEKGMWKRRS